MQKLPDFVPALSHHLKPLMRDGSQFTGMLFHPRINGGIPLDSAVESQQFRRHGILRVTCWFRGRDFPIFSHFLFFGQRVPPVLFLNFRTVATPTPIVLLSARGPSTWTCVWQASEARREGHDNSTEPPARASADNPIRIVTPSEPGLPSRLLPREFTTTHVPSKFPSISLKTKKSGTNKVTLFFEVT